MLYRLFCKPLVPVVLMFGLIVGCATDVRIDEEVAPGQTSKVIASGQFVDADRFHKGQGEATIYEGTSNSYILRLDDFEVTAGPDLKVWLVTEPDIHSAADVKASTWVSLGPLKGNIGGQNYEIPVDTNPLDYGSVVIWCEAFGVLFSPAKFKR